jgi:predicted cobalt transporter CbtA
MERRIIGRGLLAGALAGVLAFLYARVFIEPVISRAIDYESGRGDAHAAMTGMSDHDMELFTRDVQSWAGMGFGVLAFSVAMAGLFALAFTMLYPRTSGLSARMTSALLAAAGFVTVYLVPFLKYPANPPSYLLMFGLSVALALGAVWLGRRLAPKLGTWEATLTAIGAYVVAVGVVMWVLPAIDETPQPMVDKSGMIMYPGFPADDLYHFRLYALGTQVIIWATIGLVFGVLASRLLEGQRRQPLSV